MVKYGFLIKNNEIYDTKIQNFKLSKEIQDQNIIYTMSPCSYKRLYLFEALLYIYSIDKVFEILRYNKVLKKERVDCWYEDKKNHYMANIAVTNNYPPSYLNKRKFQLYKICQELKKRID